MPKDGIWDYSIDRYSLIHLRGLLVDIRLACFGPCCFGIGASFRSIGRLIYRFALGVSEIIRLPGCHFGNKRFVAVSYCCDYFEGFGVICLFGR